MDRSIETVYSQNLPVILPYHLPDFEIFNLNWQDYFFFIWQPDRVYLVLGTGNKLENSLKIENVLKENIPVLKRPSGGEAVILSPGTLIISTTVNENGFNDPKKYFSEIIRRIISVLESAGIKKLSHKGISDITIEDRKIAGSAIYRHHNKVFFHCVLNVNESSDLMEKYLNHPVREPEYRQGRSHKQFTSSLCAEGYTGKITDLIDKFENSNNL